MDNNTTGEQILRTFVKASLRALFAIGVKSQTNIDTFVKVFSEEVTKEWEKLPSDVQVTDKPKEDISTIIRNTMIVRALKTAGIETVEQLVARGQQEPFTSIKGIKDKSANIILQAIKKWNQSSS